jgi:hypothetical protein
MSERLLGLPPQPEAPRGRVWLVGEHHPAAVAIGPCTLAEAIDTLRALVRGGRQKP